MIQFSHLLLIAGTGRNTGKTLLASSIIEKFSFDFKITGIKISPHFHKGTASLHSIYQNENFNIYQENSLTSSKDSSRMLKSGASQVFYMECYDANMKAAFEMFLQTVDIPGPIVCESPALRKYIQPGLFIIVDSKANANKKQDVLELKPKADLFIETDKGNFDPVINQIRYSKNCWQLRTI